MDSNPAETDFPSFSEGLSLRAASIDSAGVSTFVFPFLFGGTFIEGQIMGDSLPLDALFPFLFGGTFIEGVDLFRSSVLSAGFPFLFGGTFIEGLLRE